MYTIKIADVEARILTPEETNRAISTLKEQLTKRYDRMREVMIDVPNGKMPGDQLFQRAILFEDQIGNYSLEKSLELSQIYSDGVAQLTETIPDFYEVYYQQGKNILAGMIPLEQLVFENPKAVETFESILGISIKDKILEAYSTVEEVLNIGLKMYQEFIKDKDEIMKFYETRMITALAKLHRRKAVFSVKCEEDVNNALNQTTVLGLKESFEKSYELFEKAFKEGMFCEEADAYRDAANYANALKLIPNKENLRKALNLYTAAKAYLGNLPTIQEGIEYILGSDLIRPENS